MSASQLLQVVSWLLYLLIFGLVAAGAVRRPTRAQLDMSLFFADTTAIIIAGTVSSTPPVWLSDLSGVLLMALPYLLLRLVADFSRVPPLLMRGAEVGLALSVAAIISLPSPIAAAPALAMVAYFLAVIGYDAWRFVVQARRTAGVTRRRMQAIALGTICLGLVLLLAGLSVAVPDRA